MISCNKYREKSVYLQKKGTKRAEREVKRRELVKTQYAKK